MNNALVGTQMQTTKTMWPVARLLTKSAILLVALFVLFRRVDFALWQSIVLTLLVFIGYESYLTLNSKASADDSFVPFRVVVLPKFDELLRDFRLLKDDASVEALHTLWKKKDQRLIAFTVLKYQASGDPLLYSDVDRCFISKIDLDEPIPAIFFRSVFDKEPGEPVCLTDPEQSRDDWHHRSPSFYFRQTLEGYELGLKVEEDWWKELHAANPTDEFVKTTVDYDLICGWARLGIAVIPYAAFAIFHTGQDYKLFHKLRDEMDAKLAAHGWTREKEDPNAEVHDPWIRIEHKYFHVQYKEV
jgi:hypothetical protein